MTSISNMFLAQYWRLETSSRLFHDFTKITISRDLAIFSSLQLPFSIFPYSPFQKNEIVESWHHWLLSNQSLLLNGKGPGTRHQSSKLSKRSLKIIALVYINQLATLVVCNRVIWDNFLLVYFQILKSILTNFTHFTSSPKNPLLSLFILKIILKVKLHIKNHHITSFYTNNSHKNHHANPQTNIIITRINICDFCSH